MSDAGVDLGKLVGRHIVFDMVHQWMNVIEPHSCVGGVFLEEGVSRSVVFGWKD